MARLLDAGVQAQQWGRANAPLDPGWGLACCGFAATWFLSIASPRLSLHWDNGPMDERPRDKTAATSVPGVFNRLATAVVAHGSAVRVRSVRLRRSALTVPPVPNISIDLIEL